MRISDWSSDVCSSDLKAPALHRYRPADGDRTSWKMPEPIGWIIERSNGEGLVAGLKQRGFVFLTPGTMMPETIGQPEPDYPDNRFNGAMADSAGRLWAATMDAGEREACGALYRLDPNLDWQVMDRGHVLANGPAFDRKRLVSGHTVSARLCTCVPRFLQT